MSTMGPEASELSSLESVNGDVKSSSSLSRRQPPGKEPLHIQSAARDALAHSADASQFLAASDYNAALHSYQQALYLYQAQKSAVGQCNAAATLHNMALLHKTCQRYDAAVQCFQEAEELYRECASHVNATNVSEIQQGQVCLDHLLVETLHNRAFVHSKYQRDINMAISCHEQVVETILNMEDDTENREQPASGDVVYVKMNSAQRVAFLAESLKNLGIFYSVRGETEGALGALEEGLEVLKCQVDECPDDVTAKKSMATVLINLGSVYFRQEQFTKAQEALQHAMDIWMDVEEDPASPEVLATVNNMGLAHERMGNLDKALECYEDFLHIKSQVLGNDHVEVADSLTTVAKVLERQSNGEGALDLYQEALRIYKVAAENEDPSLWSSAGDVLGRIGTILLEMDQVDESIEKFNEALQMKRRTLGETSEETASIYHGLGRAYMVKCRYDEARDCLLKAARMLEAVPNDGVHLDSLVESSERLKQALNNESFLSSDGTWVNAEINIEKTPERKALGTSMSPIGESSLSADPESTEDESPSDNFSLSSASSRIRSSSHLSQLQVFVNPGAPAVDSSIEIEVSPLTTYYKTPTEATAQREFDLSPVASQGSTSPSSEANDIAVGTHQASILDAIDMNSALRISPSGQGQEISLKAGPSDEIGQDQQDVSLEENSEEPWASALALARVASAEHESFHIDDSDQVNVSALATPNSAMAGAIARDEYQVESEDETGEDTEEEELHRGLMMEFSQFESQSDLGTNTADYASASDNEFESQSDLGTNMADYASASDNEYESQSDLGTNTADSASASDTETGDYTNSSFEDRTADYAVNSSSDLDTADYVNNTSSDLDTDAYQLPSVAEGDLSHSLNSTSSVGMSRTRTQGTPTEDSVHEESDFFPSEVETDAESNGAIMSSVYRQAAKPPNDSNTAISENDTQSHYSGSEYESATAGDSRYSDSEHDKESTYFVSEPEREDQYDYRQVSTDNEESDVFGTDVDTDNDSASLDKPQLSILCDSEGPQPYHGAPGELARREAPARFAQLNIDSRGMEGMVQQFARNDTTTHAKGVPSRPAAEASHHWHSNEIQQENSNDNDTIEPLLAPSVASEKKLQSPRDSRMSSPRVILAKAFKHSFRRRKSSGMIPLESMPEEKEHEPPPVVRSVRSPTSQDGVRVAPSFDPAQGTAPIRPIQYIDLQSSSFDDNVSQITFLEADASVRRRSNSNGSWWWGAPSEGEGWLPAVVGAAEEFLSARTIHDQIKSSKREASSSSTDEESDIFGNLSLEGDEGEGNEIVNGQLDPTVDDIEQTIDEDEGVVTVGMEHGTSPVVSETKRSEDPVSNPSPASNPSLPSNNSALQRRRSSSRSRPKMQDVQNTLESQCSRLGSKHPDVAETLTIMAMMKSQEGDKEASVELLHEALRIRKSVGDKAEFARTLHKLGDVYTQQKEYQSSLSCHADALNLERLVHGYQHPEIAKSLNKIGSVYARQGDFGVALSNHQHALQILKDCVGEHLSHPLVAQTLICIGAVYYKERNSLETIRAKSDGYSTFIDSGMLDVIARAHEQRGSYRMAIAFFEEKLQLLRNRDKRGMNKQEVAEALARLGTLSREAGLYLEALDYYDETENIQTAMGRNQVEIARGRLMKGTVLYHLGQYKGSLKLFKEAQTILQATVGNDQQLLIGETFQWIGKVQTELCDYESAMKALKIALEMQTVALGSDHPTTLKSRLAIASVLLHKAKMDASINLLTAILETQGRIHGPKHPNLAETMYYIGKAYMMKGDIVSAMKFFEESFFMAEKFLGHDHPSQASTLHCIADLQRAKRRYKKSLQLLTSVLDMRRDTLGDSHISVAMTLCSIAACHAATGRFAESTKYIDEALPIAERAVGNMHPAVGLILVTHGNLYLRKCQFEQAREMIERGLEVYVSCNVSKKHPHRLEAKETLERVERDEALCV